jgi:RecJ-like exonuclease
MGEERAKLMETLKEGSVVRGVVKNITEYGAFVDLGGIDGLLHITDMAWRRVRHPSEVVRPARKSPPRSSSSTPRRTACRWVSSRWATTPGWA